MTPQRLPDTGGYYFDRQDGVLAVARRNAESAVNTVQSGDAGAQAMAAVAGAVAFAIGRRLFRGD